MQTRQRLILASASPRRRSLLESACFQVEVRVPNADESWPGGTLHEGAVALARRKLATLVDTEALALAADTLVVLGERRLGKPADAAEAAGMLRDLAGRDHQVVTGFAVQRAGKVRGDAVVTRVRFRQLLSDEIERYVETGEPFDKAGAYAIQGGAGAFVDRIEGSYTNVVGLPLAEVIQAMEALA